jgi:hypothetical protein
MSEVTTEFKLTTTMHNRCSIPPIFILCDKCYWCVTYLDKTRIPIHNSCPKCNTDGTELSSFPIMSNKSFTIDYNEKRVAGYKYCRKRRVLDVDGALLTLL